MNSEGLSYTEQLVQLNAAALIVLSKKVDTLMAAIEDLTKAEAALSAVINDAVLRVRALEAAVAVVPPANEAAIADIASRLVHLREYLASAVYAMPTEVPPAPPAPVVEAPVAVDPVVAAPVVEAPVAPVVEAPVVVEAPAVVDAIPAVVEDRTPTGAAIVDTAALPSIGG